MSKILEQFVEINQLYRFYYPLLTEKQRNFIEYYYHQNYTLSEIAELERISRNAVHDQLKRTVNKLYDFEHKINLLEKHKARTKIIEALKDRSDKLKVNELLEALEKVE